ncbi:MAG: hypothetical protein ACUVWP_06400 [bacterium]
MKYSIYKLTGVKNFISSVLIIICLISSSILLPIQIYAETEEKMNEKLPRNFFEENKNVSAWEIIRVVKDILALKDRPLLFWDANGNLCETTDATFHSQTLYDGAYLLINNSDGYNNPYVMNIAIDWIGQLEEKYRKYKVYLSNLGVYSVIPQTSILKLDIYKNLNDRENYADILLNTFSSYGSVEYDSFEYNSYYGLELIYKLIGSKQRFGVDFILEMLDEMSELSSTRLLKSAVLYNKGNIIAEDPHRRDEAISLYRQVIVEYPDVEYKNYMWYQNFAQLALLNVIKLLPTENERVSFIRPYTDNNTPFPVRYFALYLLAYGEEGLLPYGEKGLIKPDTKYQRIFDDIKLPDDKKYWFEH